MKKVCVITCYRDPDYVRARTLRAALRLNPNNDVVVIKNSRRDVLRYLEIVIKLLVVRFRQNPDVYVLTFRGYELLPFFNLITIGKKRIFDEFINLVEWTVYEHKKLRAGSLSARLLYALYKSWLRHSDIILADTNAHAEYSAKLMKLPIGKFRVVPVSTDEELFKPQKQMAKQQTFQVFYYGSMLPLHGLQYIIEAAILLRDDSTITFLLVGGNELVAEQIKKARAQGAHIKHKKWIPFEQLPSVAAQSALCLGGPFGDTLQGSMVITGKTYQLLATGVPTLIGKTNVASPLLDEKNCLIVPQGDAEAIAKKISWAKDNQSKLQDIGHRGHGIYEQYYSNKVVSNIMKDIIGSL